MKNETPDQELSVVSPRSKIKYTKKQKRLAKFEEVSYLCNRFGKRSIKITEKFSNLV